jgi:heat-inducible transcriptional repressor
MELKPRQKAILSALIEKYVETAEPVGSSVISSNAALAARFGALSGATVRNELAELENLGLLSQPHTSAGRIPTDAGYRLYVNEMLRPRTLSRREETQLEVVAPPAASVDEALREAMGVLARLTGYPAVASLPGTQSDNVRWLQLNPVPPRRLILVLGTQAGRIEHRLFEVGDNVTPERLQIVVNFLNDVLSGRSLAQSRALDFETLSLGLHDATVISLAKRAWEMVRDAVNDISDERIVVQGLITLLDEPEFAETGSARAALRLLEDEHAMGGLLRSAQELRGMTELPPTRAVRIGRELPPLDHPNAQFFSFVGVSYGVADESWGALGVLGPARMRYGDVLALVPALAARLQLTLETF